MTQIESPRQKWCKSFLSNMFNIVVVKIEIIYS